MKTLIVLTDTHGNVEGIKSISGLFAENDYIIHLGDYVRDIAPYLSEYGDKIYAVRGNCDFFSTDEDEIVIEVEDVRILLTHGHNYSVKSGYERLAERAKRQNCSVALFGHTHNAFVGEVNGVKLINAGSMSRRSCEASYCYLVINGKAVVATIVKV